MEKILEILRQEAKSLFQSESSGHDIYHLERVFSLALHLQEKEGGDKLVIAVSAFLHDVHRIIQNETGRYCSPKDSLPKVREILEKAKISEDKIKIILHCIEFHEEYNFSTDGKSVDDVETMIVQDADNLDAIGAIGIVRAFVYCGANKIPIWLPDLPFNREVFDESEKDPSEIHHFYSKLLRLKDNMNTETAKRMALKRHKFMEVFLKQFFTEWNGNK